MRYWLECCDRAAVPVGERHQKESIWEEKLAACVWRHVEGLLSSGALRAALDERGRRRRGHNQIAKSLADTVFMGVYFPYQSCSWASLAAASTVSSSVRSRWPERTSR